MIITRTMNSPSAGSHRTPRTATGHHHPIPPDTERILPELISKQEDSIGTNAGQFPPPPWPLQRSQPGRLQLHTRSPHVSAGPHHHRIIYVPIAAACTRNHHIGASQICSSSWLDRMQSMQVSLSLRRHRRPAPAPTLAHCSEFMYRTAVPVPALRITNYELRYITSTHVWYYHRQHV